MTQAVLSHTELCTSSTRSGVGLLVGLVAAAWFALKKGGPVRLPLSASFLYVQNPEERQFDFMGEGDLPTSANSLDRRCVCADHPGINSVTIPRSFTTIDSGTVISSVSLLVGNFLPSACARDIQSAAPTAAHTSLSSGGPPRPLRH